MSITEESGSRGWMSVKSTPWLACAVAGKIDFIPRSPHPIGRILETRPTDALELLCTASLDRPTPHSKWPGQFPLHSLTPGFGLSTVIRSQPLLSFSTATFIDMNLSSHALRPIQSGERCLGLPPKLKTKMLKNQAITVPRREKPPDDPGSGLACLGLSWPVFRKNTNY